MRFRGAASTNLGSVTIRSSAISTWNNNNSYYLDKRIKEVDDDYTDIVEFISAQLQNILLLKSRSELKLIANEISKLNTKTDIINYLKTI